jgi:hypothetical protein
MGLDWTLHPPPRTDALQTVEQLKNHREALLQALVEVERQRVLQDGLDAHDASVDADLLDLPDDDHNPPRKVMTLGLPTEGWHYAIFEEPGEAIEVSRREDRIAASFDDEPFLTLDHIADEGFAYTIDRDGDLARFVWPEPVDVRAKLTQGLAMLNPAAHARRRRADALVQQMQQLDEEMSALRVDPIDVLELTALGKSIEVDERFRARLAAEHADLSEEELDAQWREVLASGEPPLLTTPYDDALPRCWGMFNRLWFRGQQAGYAASELGDEALARRCWEPISADEAITLAERFERSAAEASEEQADAAEIALGAARWLRFWGAQGFGVDPWF